MIQSAVERLLGRTAHINNDRTLLHDREHLQSLVILVPVT